LKGVELIHEKLRSTLISKGLEQVEVKAGDAFDADFAEATQIPAPSPKMKGKIVDVLEKDINWEINYSISKVVIGVMRTGVDAMNWVCAFIRKN
jgi:hypothetical protein